MQRAQVRQRATAQRPKGLQFAAAVGRKWSPFHVVAQGVLATMDQGKENQCARELIQLLADVLTRHASVVISFFRWQLFRLQFLPERKEGTLDGKQVAKIVDVRSALAFNTQPSTAP